MASHLFLNPAIVENGKIDDLLRANRSISLAVSPRANNLAIFMSPAAVSEKVPPRPQSQHDQDIYFAGWDHVEQERRKFMSESYVVFSRIREYNASRPKKDSMSYVNQALESRLTMTVLSSVKIDNTHYTAYSKHVQGYIDLMISHLNSLPDDPSLTSARIRFERMYTSFELFHTLYLPSHGFHNALVGRELLQWLNSNVIAARDEEGIMLLKLDRPWEHDDFWPYLARCTIRGFLQIVSRFLGILGSKHPSPRLQQLCAMMVPILETYPSSEDFTHDREFFTAIRQVNNRLTAVRKELDRAPEHDRSQGWYDDFSDVIGILQGNKDTVSRICSEGDGAGWLELICVWGVWIHPGLTRDELPEVCTEIFLDLPADSTLHHESLQAGLFAGDAYKAAIHANELDPWLGAHMADLMEAMDLFDNPPDPTFTLRHHLLLTYAEHLLSDPSYWRVAVSYMDACGELGLARMREVLIRMPLRIRPPSGADTDAAGTSGEDETLREIIDACDEYKLHDVKDEICRTAVREFIGQRQYGKAVEYCARVFDLRTLNHVVDSLLEEYIIHGATELIDLVNQIPAIYLYPDINQSSPSAFSERLRFLVKFTEYHCRTTAGKLSEAASDLVAMFRDELAPKYWWGVLLVEAGDLLRDDDMLLSLDEVHELLRRLEEVAMGAEHGAGADYLGALQRRASSSPHDEKWALQQLLVVRLALAQYLGRSATIHVGGKGPIVFN